MNNFWQRLQRLSLYYKVNGLIIGMLFLSSLIIGFIMLQSTSRLLNNQMEKRGIEIASYVASLSSNDILIDLDNAITRTQSHLFVWTFLKDKWITLLHMMV